MADSTDVMERLAAYALEFPEAWHDQPFENDLVAKVRRKIFVFFGSSDHPGLTVKLTDSLDQALAAEGAEPAGHGLGRWGWVSIPIGRGGSPPEPVSATG